VELEERWQRLIRHGSIIDRIAKTPLVVAPPLAGRAKIDSIAHPRRCP
jgi:hypothetical protein